MGKKKEKKEDPPQKKGGCVKKLGLAVLLFLLAYSGFHIFFIWQPAGKPAEFNRQVMEAHIGGVKVFPAVQAFDLDKIAGRSEVIAGTPIKAPPLKSRLENAIQQGYPVTFREEEINVWLSKRLALKQGGLLAPFVTARAVWVDFKKDEIEVIIERELPKQQIHVTSLFMRFDRQKNGFSISRHASQIGQVKAPGGFARLVMPAFNRLADELADELALYKTPSEKLIIHDVVVEEGKITLDPRRADQR